MKWNIGHADPNVYNISIYENPRSTSIPLFYLNFNNSTLSLKKEKKRLRIERIESFEAWRGEDGKFGELKSH